VTSHSLDGAAQTTTAYSEDELREQLRTSINSLCRFGRQPEPHEYISIEVKGPKFENFSITDLPSFRIQDPDWPYIQDVWRAHLHHGQLAVILSLEPCFGRTEKGILVESAYAAIGQAFPSEIASRIPPMIIKVLTNFDFQRCTSDIVRRIVNDLRTPDPSWFVVRGVDSTWEGFYQNYLRSHKTRQKFHATETQQLLHNDVWSDAIQQHPERFGCNNLKRYLRAFMHFTLRDVVQSTERTISQRLNILNQEKAQAESAAEERRLNQMSASDIVVEQYKLLLTSVVPSTGSQLDGTISDLLTDFGEELFDTLRIHRLRDSEDHGSSVSRP
jgi:hypothetical protein